MREIAAFLDRRLGADQFPEPGNGAVAGGDLPVGRLGLALEPTAALAEWIQRQAPNAVLLHRAWGLDPAALPPATGVLAYHGPFDHHLTLGQNPLLADALGMGDVRPLGIRRGRCIGMIGRVGPAGFDELLGRVRREFRGVESVIPPREERVAHVAVVGAMDDALVREAAERGAGMYLTGQLRTPGRAAVERTGIGVVAVGHARSERWGLRALAALLRRRWPKLEVLVHDPEADQEPLPC